jgi:hypothetical protein
MPPAESRVARGGDYEIFEVVVDSDGAVFSNNGAGGSISGDSE